MSAEVGAALEQAYRDHWAHVLAVTIRRTRDVDVAEDITQEAFLRAMSSWREGGVPPSPGGWLMTTARNIELDGLRRQQVLARKLPLMVIDPGDDSSQDVGEAGFGDERLRLVFTCCHPALALPARVALSLRLVCGLSTETIARLFLVQPATMAARITRAKRKIQAAGIPYRVPTASELAARVHDVLTVIYLVYTEGHTASDGVGLRRADLVCLSCDLVGVMRTLLPDDPEVMALAALIRLTEARQATRFDALEGAVLLEEMDRSQWDRSVIADGLNLVERSLRRTQREQPGVYVLQASIAALHAEAPSFAETDWGQVIAFYTLLMRRQPTPVFGVARALAMGMHSGPEAGLRELDALDAAGVLASYSLLPAARADLLRRAGRSAEAAIAYRAASALATNIIMARDFEARAARLMGDGLARNGNATQPQLSPPRIP